MLCRQLCKFPKELWIMIYRKSDLATTAGQEKIHVTICHNLPRCEFSLDESRTHFLLWISHLRNHNVRPSVLLISATLWTPLLSELKMLALSMKIPCFSYCLASSSVVFRIGSGWFKALLGQWPIDRHWKAAVRLTYQLFCRERPPFRA